jgi:ArsR family transcriptional regulator
MMDKENLAKMLKALSDPTRLNIFDMLMEGVQCNCEISERLELSLSLVSHHLRTLRQVGLVQGERDSEDARWIYYSIDQEALVQLGQAMNHLLDVKRIQPRVPSCGPQRCDNC